VPDSSKEEETMNANSCGAVLALALCRHFAGETYPIDP